MNTCPFPGNHTSARIASVLEQLVSDWEVPVNACPFYVVTDNARNMRAATRGLSWHERTCFAHTLQLAIADAKVMTPGLVALCKKARGIVGHYKHSPKAQERLNCCRKKMDKQPLHVVQDVETRWNSELSMLSRLLELRDAITMDLASEDGHLDCFSASEWRQMGGYVAALKPLEEATTTVGADHYPTLSAQVPVLYCLFMHLDKTNWQGEASVFAANLAKCLKTRFPDYKFDQVASLAMFLDPRFKVVVYHQDDSMANWVKNLALEEANKISTRNPEIPSQTALQGETPSTSALWKDFDSLINQQQSSLPRTQVERYVHDEVLGRKEDPCEWWFKHGTQSYPLLALLAKRYLPIPATSVSSERLFSVSGGVVTSRRLALLPEHVEQLTFLHDNI